MEAYRLASIGLVGNSVIAVTLIGIPSSLTDWLRSDWLETYPNGYNIDLLSHYAYRLASIGLVGNSESKAITLYISVLTDWLRSDWLETPNT